MSLRFVGLDADLREALRCAVADPRVARTYDLRTEEDARLPPFPNPTGYGTRIDMAARLADDTLIGVFTLDVDRLSYFVMPEQWGKGYGKQLVHGALRYAFETFGFPRLEALVVRENVASIRILEAHGFRFRGIEALDAGRTGNKHTSLLYTLEAHEFLGADAHS